MSGRYFSRFGKNVRRLRQARGFSQEHLAEMAELDRSYVGGIERGERNPALKTIVRLAAALDISPDQFFRKLDTTPLPENHLAARQIRRGIQLTFKYDQYDATYDLDKATISEFEAVIEKLRSGLQTSPRSDTVASTFLFAMELWPHANPSDIWTFLINRAYCDRNNHPQKNARLNLEQSWKRTSGWALEAILARHYGPFLESNGITLIEKDTQHKRRLLDPLNDPRLIAEKADFVVTLQSGEREKLLGVIHVKASMAERRTDDVPMSQALIDAGLLSILWTMDVKSMPSATPENSGEFGQTHNQGRRSEKRKDLEEHGHFSACFSYNRNTLPTPSDYDAKSSIAVCDFRNPDDAFTAFLRSGV